MEQNATKLVDSVETFKDYLQTNGKEVVVRGIEDFLLQILDFAHQFVGHCAKRVS